MQAIIFDLDDALIPETAAVTRALLLTAEAARKRFGIDPNALSQAVLRHAEAMWRAAPTSKYCERMGIAAWEGLTSDFHHFAARDDDADCVYLRGWVSSYRHDAWHLALEDLGVRNSMAARELAERFRTVRFETHTVRDGAHKLLDGLRERGYTLAVLTNGPADLQGQKLVKTGLNRHFDNERTFISGAMGLGKPNLDLFRIVLERLSVEPCEAVMAGDNVYRDIDPALACGLHAVWMRNGRIDDLLQASVPRVDALTELPEVIEALEAERA